GEQVAAGQRDRNRRGLDRGRRRIALIGERAQQRGRKPESFKRHVAKLQVDDRTPRRAGRGSFKSAQKTRSVPTDRATGVMNRGGRCEGWCGVVRAEDRTVRWRGGVSGQKGKNGGDAGAYLGSRP